MGCWSPGRAATSLRVEPGQLDVDRFETLAAQGREALEKGDALTAAAVLREALGVWRGPALADFAYEPFAQAEIARLEESRLAALEDRIDADLASGEACAAGGRARGARARASVARAPSRSADARAVPVAGARPTRWRPIGMLAVSWSTGSGSSRGARCRSSSERSWLRIPGSISPPLAPLDRRPRSLESGCAALR